MLATEYAKWYDIAPQEENESDSAFRNRVSGILRNSGNIIEAHEVAQDARWDSESGGDMVQKGLLGAMAMALQNKNYGRDGSDLVGDEIAAGVIATSPKQDLDPMMVLLSVMLFDKR